MKALYNLRVLGNGFSALLVLLTITIASPEVVAAQSKAGAYECGGAVETRIWSTWNKRGRAHAKDELIRDRLLGQGDTYALYDLEIAYHNLLAMAVRCGRDERLLQFAKDWWPAFSGLRPVSSSGSIADIVAGSSDAPMARMQSDGLAWICRGGSDCNKANRLLGKEVRLVSMQGLALFVELANHLKQRQRVDPVTELFVSRTRDVTIDHLNRWGGEKDIAALKAATIIKDGEIADGRSTWLFTDSALWQIGLYAELAGLLHENQNRYDAEDGEEAVPRDAIKVLLAFFNSRLSYRSTSSASLSAATVADLDGGYWRHYKDGRYAGYEGKKPPAECKSGEGSLGIRYDDTVPVPPVVRDLGWDISHARRLVHVLASLDRNREAMKSVYGLAEEELPPTGLAERFSAQMVASIWNHDPRRPLFSNWMSGANGWYRVGYDNRTGRCVQGFPPYGLSDAFATGGYVTWARYHPLLAALGRTIYDSAQSEAHDDVKFVQRYYPSLAFKAGRQPSQAQLIGRMMFWPTLVESTSRVH